MKLGWGLWQGSYQGIERLWLRWYDANNQWIPTAQELEEQQRAKTEQAQLQLEQVQSQLEQEQPRAERLAEQLKAMGIEPENS